MDIQKLREKAIKIVIKNSDAFGDRLEKESKTLSDKAEKCKKIIAATRRAQAGYKQTLLELMSVILDEEISLDRELAYIPCHAIAVVNKGDKEIQLVMGSIYMEYDDDDEGGMFHRILSSGKKKSCKGYKPDKLSSPLSDQMKSFIEELPEKTLRSEFHYLDI